NTDDTNEYHHYGMIQSITLPIPIVGPKLSKSKPSNDFLKTYAKTAYDDHDISRSHSHNSDGDCKRELGLSSGSVYSANQFPIHVDGDLKPEFEYRCYNACFCNMFIYSRPTVRRRRRIR